MPIESVATDHREQASAAAGIDRLTPTRSRNGTGSRRRPITTAVESPTPPAVGGPFRGVLELLARLVTALLFSASALVWLRAAVTVGGLLPWAATAGCAIALLVSLRRAMSALQDTAA
jgi:hypothetical protein